jgi:excinuclease ABC subunit C
MPDLVIIDGGRGQLTRALQVLEDLGLGETMVVGIAKGAARRAGYEEWVFPPPRSSLRPGPDSTASHLVQNIRDEAHRFAITGHRGQRQKAAVRSELEEIAGVGPGRRRALLTHFGGMKGVRAASAEQLASVHGISKALARRIFGALH